VSTVNFNNNCQILTLLLETAWKTIFEDDPKGKRRPLTAGTEPRKSCIVKGGGIMKALNVVSGEFSGSGMDARNAFLALSNSSGSSVLGGVYYRNGSVVNLA
jgi:hypothetical protein